MIGASASTAFAQPKYPNRPIRLLVPFAPGGGVDVVARIVGRKVSEALGQPILVESKPGGGGAVAVGELMRSAADGYTLLMTTSAHATLPKLNKLPWHPSNDFTLIASIYSYMFDYSSEGQIFVLGPKGLPASIQTRLNSEFAAALDDKEVRARLVGFGLGVPDSRHNTVAALKKHIDDFQATYDKLIAELGIEAK